MHVFIRSAVIAGLGSGIHPVLAGDDVIFSSGFEPAAGFTIQLPQLTVPAGVDRTVCYYFDAPNTTPIAVNRWSSTMGAAMQHLIVFATYTDGWVPMQRQPAGTLTEVPCGILEGGGKVAWLYAAHESSQSLDFPVDDGGGLPLAVTVAAGQPMFVQMYVPNATDASLSASATLRADALPADEPYTPTATYLTLNTNISVSPGMGVELHQNCLTPPDSTFWWLSTRTHRHATESRIADGGSVLVVSTDWAHPAQARPDPFHVFSNALTYSCTYFNDSGFPLHFGQSETTDETCTAIGYFFPADHGALCLNGSGPL